MKTFVTVGAVDGFDAGTEWTYRQVQKQFGPKRFAEMKASGTIVTFESEAELDGAKAERAMAASLPSGAGLLAASSKEEVTNVTDLAEFFPDEVPATVRVEANEAQGVPEELSVAPSGETAAPPKKLETIGVTPAPATRLSRKEKRKGGLTPLQALVMGSLISEEVGRTAAEIAKVIGLPGQAIKVSGILSSLVERGALATEKVAGYGEGGLKTRAVYSWSGKHEAGIY